jgi:LuxR family maltose regulon positive regulatory protein
VSPNTVTTQARTLYRKLGVSTRDEAVAAARSGGLLRPT